MILLVESDTIGSFAAACELAPILGAQVYTDYLVRGGAGPDAGFWVAVDSYGRPAAAIGLVDGRMTVSCDGGFDAAEFTAFARAMGSGLGQVTAPAELCRRLGLTGHQFAGPCMVYTGGVFGGDYSPIVSEPPIRELFDTILAGFPGYSDVWERWYANTSHLLRHGLGYAAGIYEGGRMAATGGVYSMGARVGVIACVATLEPYRGRGYAGLIVRYLCDRLLTIGKTPALACAEESLAEYYGAMGFRLCGRWGRIQTGGRQ